MQKFSQSNSQRSSQVKMQELINRVLSIRDKNFRRFSDRQRLSETINQLKIRR